MDKDTARAEAFSDGVFAIAITLLILEIRVPALKAAAANGPLFSALAGLWPSFLAFFLSFFVILVMWVNHHEFMRLVHHVDYPFLFANGFVPLLVTFVPFPTAVLARYLGTGAAPPPGAPGGAGGSPGARAPRLCRRTGGLWRLGSPVAVERGRRAYAVRLIMGPLDQALLPDEGARHWRRTRLAGNEISGAR